MSNTQLQSMFDATNIDPSQGTPSLPVGKHPVIIKEGEVKGTKDNTGGLAALTLEIIDGPQKGTTGVYRINLYNASQEARDIAQRQLSALCHVTGVFKVQDLQQLYGKPFMIEVGLQKGEEAAAKGYTEVKRVYDINGNEPGKAPAAAPQQNNNGGNAGGFQNNNQNNNAGNNNGGFGNGNNQNTNGGGQAQWNNGNNNAGNNSNQGQTNGGGNNNWGGNNGGNNGGNAGGAPWTNQ